MFHGKSRLNCWIKAKSRMRRTNYVDLPWLKKTRLKHRHADLWLRIVQRSSLDSLNSNGWHATPKQPHNAPKQGPDFIFLLHWHISHWHIFQCSICWGKADHCVQVPRLEGATRVNQYVTPSRSGKSNCRMSFYSHPKVCWDIIHQGCRENPWERKLDIAWSI